MLNSARSSEAGKEFWRISVRSRIYICKLRRNFPVRLLKAESPFLSIPSSLFLSFTLLTTGIVRGVDPEKGILYLITPLDLETLQCVDTLLQGWIEVPLPLLQVGLIIFCIFASLSIEFYLGRNGCEQFMEAHLQCSMKAFLSRCEDVKPCVSVFNAVDLQGQYHRKPAFCSH